MFLAGCTAAGPGAHNGDSYIVNSQRTLFYSYGPAQASGPDFALAQGQRVTMLSYAYGFSHVTVQATGQSGYVATEDLAPAPPPPKPGPSPAHRHRSADSGPPEDEGPIHIPLPEYPESKPPPGAPAFRY
jgi:hypothetical protein